MITVEELKQLMEDHGFHEYVYEWKPDGQCFAIGVESHSILFMPIFDLVAIWPNGRPYRQNGKYNYARSGDWLLHDETDMEYRRIDLEWWARFKPVYAAIVSSFPVGKPLSSEFLKWVHAFRNVRWCNGIKVKRVRPPKPAAVQFTDNAETHVDGDGNQFVVNKPHEAAADQVEKEKPFRRQKSTDKVSFMSAALGRSFPNLAKNLRRESLFAPRPLQTLEKHISQYLRSNGVSHVWSDSDGEHVLHFVDYVVRFDISNELIEIENRCDFQSNTHGWNDWLKFGKNEIRSCGIAPRIWDEKVRPVILRVVQMLHGAYV